ncbi:Mitochondrial proton/calcium exchanger like protein [Argiope bruennichi]|uniref:Mitochondrial proton/calcium exchanger like protein n=1 Tax=Argiope bruennichi TaxID=94029 RepID=A0A8T0ENL2_ARGBR|nr:Mitochondrial proton/calcium exchanger like protein [Argiope bruennichi]
MAKQTSDLKATETKLKIGEMEGKVDNKTKLELIKKQEEEIKKEAEELKQQKLEAEQKKEELSKKEKAAELDEYDKEILLDKAKIIEDRAELLEKSPPEAKENELSKEDFEEIESALENIAAEKNKLIIEKEEIEDLKEEMAEYKQDIKELQDVVLETGHKEYIDSKVKEGVSIGKERSLAEMAELDHNGRSFNKDRDDIIGINELVLAIRRIQKVSDDTRLQRIADVLEKMDVDHDGAVEIDHVLKVIELLGEDNVKVTPEQMEGIIDLLMKEEALELEEKLMKENAADGKKTEEQSNK